MKEISSEFNAVILSICAGIFLYVALLDIACEELADLKNKIWKMVAFLLGVILNIIVSLIN